MRLPPEAIAEYKEIYLDQFGIELTDQEAYEKAHNLITLTRLAMGEENVLP